MESHTYILVNHKHKGLIEYHMKNNISLANHKYIIFQKTFTLFETFTYSMAAVGVGERRCPLSDALQLSSY